MTTNLTFPSNWMWKDSIVCHSLMPNVPNAPVIQNFRPICFFNVSYKILTKVVAKRPGLIIQKVISDSQTGFLSGRYIVEGVVVLHEVFS